jgi:hypothetical protein
LPREAGATGPRDERAYVAAGIAQHATARPESGEHDGGGPEGGNGECAASVGYHQQHRQHRHEHHRAGPGRPGEDARRPRYGDIAIVEDDFVSFAHRRSEN